MQRDSASGCEWGPTPHSHSESSHRYSIERTRGGVNKMTPPLQTALAAHPDLKRPRNPVSRGCLADPRQLLARQHVDDAPGAQQRSRSTTRPGCSPVTRPMTARLAARSGCARMAARTASAALGRHDRDELALVGDVQRIEAQQLAGRRAPRRARGSASSSISMPTPRATAISFRVVARPPRVGSRRQRMRRARRSSMAATRPLSGAQSLSSGAVEAQPLALAS